MAPAQAPPSETSSDARSHRERGNDLFKQGKLRKAIREYWDSQQCREEGFVLAISNRAICHLRLSDYAEAVIAADLCLKEEDAPLKVHLTKFKALAGKKDWIGAFGALRRLRALGELPPDVEAAAAQEERAKRAERISLCQADGFDERVLVVNDDDDPAGRTEPQLLHFSLPRTVELIVPEDQAVASIDIVGGRHEDPFTFAEGRLMAKSCTVRMVGPEVSRSPTPGANREPAEHLFEEHRVVNGREVLVKYMVGLYHDMLEASEAPELAVIGCPNFDSGLDDWLPTLRRLVEMQVLTVVTGYSRDQSCVQNEDILRALGCEVVAGTARSPHVFRHMVMCKNYHYMAFRGGRIPDLDLPAFKAQLLERGFEIS